MQLSQTQKNEAAPRRYSQLAQMPMAGKWRDGSSGKRAADRDPFTGKTLIEHTLATAGDVDLTYRFAAQAQRRWAATLPQERREIFQRVVELMGLRRDEIVDWLIKESGSTRLKANLEWELVRGGVIEASTYPSRVAGSILPSSIPGKETRVYRVPVGVVGVISPWNFPFQLTNRSIAPALAVGNAVVVKPASDTPVTGGLLLAALFEEAGLPPGVLSVVIGAGKDIGDAFVDHPVPRVISFTGSTEVGRHLAEHAGRAVKKVCLELGGNSPFVVLADADVERAVDAAVFGKFLHQGQICMAINRIIVNEAVHDEFLERFTQRVASLRFGDPSSLDTVVGPLINQAQFDGLTDKVERTLKAGARQLVGGPGDGLVFRPTVLADVTNDMPAAQEELFGPVAPLIRARDDDEALRLANDTEFGLSSAVFTRNLEHGVEFALGIEAGMTHINDMPVNDEPNTAFGGEKASGLGRFGGLWAVEEFTTDHWISVQHVPRQYPF